MQISEFCKVIDVSDYNIIHGQILIIWEWEVIQAQDDDIDDDIDESSVESSSPAPDSETEVDAHVQSRPTDTIPFKVIGCNKERRYQEVLERVSLLMDNGVAVPVEFRVEPENPYDPNAIAFVCKVQDSFERIGYVVREAQGAVHDAMGRNDIIMMKFKWVKYQTDWYRCGPGFFSAINVTKRGAWPSVVVRARSTR